MIEYRKIDKQEKSSLVNLINEVLDNLERKEFFIPFTDEEIEDMFNKNKIITFGAYDKGKLVGTAQLYIEQSAVSEIKEILELKSDKVAELGGYLVLKDYRNQGIMKQLQTILINIAKEMNYEYIVITVHPDNITSNKTTEYTGAKIKKTTNLGNYLRNIYLLEL